MKNDILVMYRSFFYSFVSTPKILRLEICDFIIKGAKYEHRIEIRYKIKFKHSEVK